MHISGTLTVEQGTFAFPLPQLWPGSSPQLLRGNTPLRPQAPSHSEPIASFVNRSNLLKS